MVRNHEAVGSIPTGSTTLRPPNGGATSSKPWEASSQPLPVTKKVPGIVGAFMSGCKIGTAGTC
jgi:murein endopeptidase